MELSISAAGTPGPLHQPLSPHAVADDPSAPFADRYRNEHWQYTKRLRLAVLIATYAAISVIAGILIWQLASRGAERHVVAIVVAGIFVLVALPLSLNDINGHMQNLVSPLQRHYIRILAMVPIYALESWLALVFREQRIYLETLREAYEAYVIYSFGRLLLEFLGERPAIVALLQTRGHERAHMIFPLCKMKGWRFDASGEFVNRASLGVFQYVVVRTTLACVSIAAEWGGALCEGSWASPGKCFYPWISFSLNVSQAWAMYCLVLVYHELQAELAPLKPFGKLVAIKAVVFFSFWQGIVIGALVDFGVIQATLTYDTADIAAALQDFLICIEMAAAASLHHFIFSRTDFKGTAGEKMRLYAEGRLDALAAVRVILPSDVIVEAHSTGKAAVLGAHAAALDAVKGARTAGGNVVGFVAGIGKAARTRPVSSMGAEFVDVGGAGAATEEGGSAGGGALWRGTSEAQLSAPASELGADGVGSR